MVPVGDGLAEVVLRPLGKPLVHIPGQFAMVHLETKTGWHRHPFTVASSPAEPHVRFTIKALGDFTGGVSQLVQPGMPALLSGPHGRFSHSKGTERQVWIAGGVGVTPFLSWVRSLDHVPLRGAVDFFYTVASGEDEIVPYASEIRSRVEAHPQVAFHLVRSRIDGRLTAGGLLDICGGHPEDLSVFMCGPQPMVRSLQMGFREAGVRSGRIFREYFDF